MLAASYGGLQARLELSLWPTQRWAFISAPRAAEVELRMGSGALALCSQLLRVGSQPGQLQLLGCVRGALVQLASLASDDYGAGTMYYATLGSRVGAGWRYSGLHVQVLGGLDVARGQPALGPASGGNRFVGQNAQLAAALAIGWQFGGVGAE